MSSKVEKKMFRLIVTVMGDNCSKFLDRDVTGIHHSRSKYSNFRATIFLVFVIRTSQLNDWSQFLHLLWPY